MKEPKNIVPSDYEYLDGLDLHMLTASERSLFDRLVAMQFARAPGGRVQIRSRRDEYYSVDFDTARAIVHSTPFDRRCRLPARYVKNSNGQTIESGDLCIYHAEQRIRITICTVVDGRTYVISLLLEGERYARVQLVKSMWLEPSQVFRAPQCNNGSK